MLVKPCFIVSSSGAPRGEGRFGSSQHVMSSCDRSGYPFFILFWWILCSNITCLTGMARWQAGPILMEVPSFTLVMDSFIGRWISIRHVPAVSSVSISLCCSMNKLYAMAHIGSALQTRSVSVLPNFQPLEVSNRCCFPIMISGLLRPWKIRRLVVSLSPILYKSGSWLEGKGSSPRYVRCLSCLDKIVYIVRSSRASAHKPRWAQRICKIPKWPRIQLVCTLVINIVYEAGFLFLVNHFRNRDHLGFKIT